MATRSRSGCGTCKGHRKKCDEIFGSDGSCQRCRRIGATCLRESSRPSRARRQTRESTDSRRSDADWDPSRLPGGLQQTDPGAFTVNDRFLSANSPTMTATGNSGINRVLTQDDSTEFQDFVNTWLPFLEDTADSLDPKGDDMAQRATLSPPAANANPIVSEIREQATLWWGYYNSLNDGYFFSLTKIERKLLKEQIKASFFTNDLGRASFTVMAFAHYAGILEEAADESFVEWDKRAKRFSRHAMPLLKDTSLSAGLRLGAFLDLRTAEVQRYGARHAIELLDEAEEIVRTISADPIALVKLLEADQEAMALRMTAFASVTQAVVSVDRAMPFDFEPTMSSSGSVGLSADLIEIHRLKTHLGLPVELMIAMAQLVTIQQRRRSLPPYVVESLSNDILRSTLAWRAHLYKEYDGDSIAMMNDIKISEMWRQATLIYLYTIVQGKGSFASTVRNALHQTLDLLSTPEGRNGRSTVSPPIPFTSSACALPLFLAATVAIHEDDREKCRQGLVSCGTGRTYSGNLAAIERIWEKMDENGRDIDWRGLLKNENLAVAFL